MDRGYLGFELVRLATRSVSSRVAIAFWQARSPSLMAATTHTACLQDTVHHLAAPIIDKMPTFIAAGNAGQAWSTAANSRSNGTSRALGAPHSAPPSSASALFPKFLLGVRILSSPLPVFTRGAVIACSRHVVARVAKLQKQRRGGRCTVPA